MRRWGQHHATLRCSRHEARETAKDVLACHAAKGMALSAALQLLLKTLLQAVLKAQVWNSATLDVGGLH